MFEIPIAIPTYRRCPILWQKTLRFLRTQNYPAHLITLFVADEEEKEAYIRATPELLYGQIVVGVKGLAEQRNFISQYYKEGEIICQMDDDLEDIELLRGLRFGELLDMGVKEIESGKVGLFGVLPNNDKRRFKPSMTYHLTHILGTFFVLKNHKDFVLECTEKEDFVRSIWYFIKYGAVARYRGGGVKTSFRKTAGGLQENGRQERIDDEIRRMLELYPDYVKVVEKSKGEDILLKWNATVPVDDKDLGINSQAHSNAKEW
jgi:hypothetical protein